MVQGGDIPGRQPGNQNQEPPSPKAAMNGEVNELTLKVLEVISKASSFEVRRRTLNKARRLLGKE